MPHFIDRRDNPKDKNLGNRQRFMRRARAQLKEVVNKSLRDRSISDLGSGETVTIPTKGISEPRFRHGARGGYRERIFTGNKEYATGDKIQKPRGGGEGRGKKASDQGEGEDAFQFALSRDEFLDILFEELELPDLIKANLKEVQRHSWHRAGHTVTGTASNLDVRRTMKNSLGRRIALKRPNTQELDRTMQRISELESKPECTADDLRQLESLRRRLEEIERKRGSVPFIDPFDVRYVNFESRPEPATNAVMFCLMDVSGSMGEREKDLAKRFFLLLHLFLKRRYERVDIVFIRHTHEAQEVDEETFFYSRETGGTVVSTAITEMLRVLRARYPVEDWNIYAAQASDGDNFSSDGDRCTRILAEEIMPLCQYYAYVEILDEREMEIFQNADGSSALWKSYSKVSRAWENFEMKRIAKPSDIYPVFHELFAKDRKRAEAAAAG